MQPFGDATVPLPARMGNVMELDHPLTEHEAAALVAEMLTIMLYDASFTSADAGLVAVNLELGVSS